MPFQVSSIVYGNDRYNGVGKVEYRRWDGSMGLLLEGSFVPYPRYTHPYFPFPVSISTFPARNLSVEQWCLQNCVAKASEPVHAMGVTLGELSETVKMLLSPSRAIASLCKRSGLLGGKFIRPGKGNKYTLFQPNPKVPKKLADRFGVKSKAQAGCYVVNEASDFWLTWRFGVSPLIKEIGDIMSMDWSYWDQPGVQLAKKRFREGRQTFTMPTQAIPIYGMSNWDLICDVKFFWEYYTQASLSYRLNRGYGLDEALNGYGLSLRHIPSVMWELTPLSFVIDRFVDVSTLIGSLTPDPAVIPIQNCVSRNLHAYFDVVPGRVTFYGAYLDILKEHVKPAPFRTFVNSYRRDVQIPISSWPQINPRLTTLKQYVDHATLLWQRIPTFKR